MTESELISKLNNPFDMPFLSQIKKEVDEELALSKAAGEWPNFGEDFVRVVEIALELRELLLKEQS